MKQENYRPKTVIDAVDELLCFLESDMWWSAHQEWKNERDMWKYLSQHFNILKDQIEKIRIENGGELR